MDGWVGGCAYVVDVREGEGGERRGVGHGWRRGGMCPPIVLGGGDTPWW